jgi:formate C-acetyltransferase
LQAKNEITKRKFEGQQFNLDDFPQLREMREYMVNGPSEFCIERSKLLTRFFKEKGGLDYTDPFTRQAEGLHYILKNKKANIFPNDLLAGTSTSKRKGVLFYPEFTGLGIWPELLTMPFRKKNPYQITVEEVVDLNKNILPFWMDKSISELLRQKLGEDDVSIRLQQLIFLYMVSKYQCISHTIPDYESVLENGLTGLIEEARDKMKNSDTKAKNLYKGLIIAMEGVIEYSNNTERFSY